MSNGMDVFSYEPKVSLAAARAVLERKLNPELIKERKQGTATLSYIGGHSVIRLLNEAFGYQWSFEIVSEEIVPSQPKVNKYAKPGQDPLEPQPPVAKVLGRLTVPGYGVKEQYGSKVVIGGASEQEAAFKSASTDALKKCATLFNIGLELYDDDSDTPVQSSGAQGAQPSSYSKPSAPAQTNSKPAEPAATQGLTWNDVKGDVEKLKELKTILGAEKNDQLDPFVREFMDKADATYVEIIPANIKAFNVYLAKKVQTA